ncbi:sensor histidine kinase [Blastococcus sp. URHD0036]|uniref:sensor histidine kinase n=1 Tax=Blastococcus sp. URHD0036 TaxID=1380356 RepID=UPI000AA3A6E1|nr:sensor histidine kinase [Blastococcus sp. URHD0036]
MTGHRGDWRRQWADHPYVVDALLAVLVLTVSLQPLLREAGCGCEAVPLWGYALVVGECLPLVWRRRFPFTVALVCGVLTTVHGLSDVPDPAVFFAGLVALYSVAAHGSRRLALAAAGTAAVAISLSTVVDRAAADLEDFTIPALTFATAWLLGDGARSRRLAAVRAEERAASLERTRAAEARQAVVEERNRIAREMHDVLAHSVSMMVVQAEAGPVVVERDPARAIQAFDAISATGKSALTELRRLLGVLREDAATPLAPQPGLAAVPDLVGSVRAAGVDVELRVTGELPPPSSAVDLAGYRIVQEALTNVVKHAGPARVQVRVEATVERVLLEVVDDGLGGSPATGTGRGLVGMRERAAATGGSVTAGPGPDGGWRVTAELPLAPVRQP